MIYWCSINFDEKNAFIKFPGGHAIIYTFQNTAYEASSEKKKIFYFFCFVRITPAFFEGFFFFWICRKWKPPKKNCEYHFSGNYILKFLNSAETKSKKFFPQISRIFSKFSFEALSGWYQRTLSKDFSL